MVVVIGSVAFDDSVGNVEVPPVQNEPLDDIGQEQSRTAQANPDL